MYRSKQNHQNLDYASSPMIWIDYILLYADLVILQNFRDGPVYHWKIWETALVPTCSISRPHLGKFHVEIFHHGIVRNVQGIFHCPGHVTEGHLTDVWKRVQSWEEGKKNGGNNWTQMLSNSYIAIICFLMVHTTYLQEGFLSSRKCLESYATKSLTRIWSQ